MAKNAQQEQKGAVRLIADKLYILKVPPYGNSIFYSLGFLALTSLTILAVSGVIMVFFGPTWWLTSVWGMFFRSIHLWAAQALIALIILHGFVVLATSGFKAPRRLTWTLGALAFLFLMFEAEFGYGLRGDFSSQYRALQAADFFNGAFLGKFINTLNYAQIYGIHIIDIPIIVLVILGLHYLLVKTRGIAKPYRTDIKAPLVKADHTRLFLRGGILAALILLFAVVFPSPFIAPTTIQDVAASDPSLMAQTLMQEFARTSDTATYLDSIDPYQFDTQQVFITTPYMQYIATTGGQDALAAFGGESSSTQQTNIDQATSYFENGGAITLTNANPLVPAVSALVKMAQGGLYESALNGENKNIEPTYSLRFLADTGVLDAEASALHITTDQWGMVREESGAIPPGAWWLSPLGVLDHTILATDNDGDRDGATILGLFALLLITFPYLPYVNRIPEKLHLAELIWKRH